MCSSYVSLILCGKNVQLFYFTLPHRNIRITGTHKEMHITQKYLDELTYRIIGCAIEVHRQFGPGLLESVYEKCFIRELELKGLNYVSQRIVPVNYNDTT